MTGGTLGRISKLVDKLLPKARRASDWHTRSVSGLSFNDLLEAVEAACPQTAEAVTLLGQLAEQVEESNGEHGFMEWLNMLGRPPGEMLPYAKLPRQMPLIVLKSYRDWYAEGPGIAMPYWRCHECFMALPHARMDQGQFQTCPVCGSEHLELLPSCHCKICKRRTCDLKRCDRCGYCCGGSCEAAKE